MILHVGIMALLFGSGIVMLMMLYASTLGIQILLKWDFNSSSPQQLALERKTYLISTLTNYAFAFIVLSGLLFVFTADDIHSMFVGAMCAVGSLNANPIGWNVLWLKIFIFFPSAIWLALNYFDQQAEDFPLVKLKYFFLLLITPLIALDLYFQIQYFLGLHPEYITSCCGALFSSQSSSIAGSLAGMPVKRMIWIFYSCLFLYCTFCTLCFFTKAAIFRYLVSLSAIVFFLVAITSIVSFISIYIYEIPSHHCPFDILQKNYGYIGYPIYITLFCGVLFGLFPGVFQALKRYRSVSEKIRHAEKKWMIWAVTCTLCFAIISSWHIIYSNLTMKTYY